MESTPFFTINCIGLLIVFGVKNKINSPKILFLKQNSLWKNYAYQQPAAILPWF
jgi:hypothetical protein